MTNAEVWKVLDDLRVLVEETYAYRQGSVDAIAAHAYVLREIKRIEAEDKP